MVSFNACAGLCNSKAKAIYYHACSKWMTKPARVHWNHISATVTAVGVANPIAHGQATKSTERPNFNAKSICSHVRNAPWWWFSIRTLPVVTIQNHTNAVRPAKTTTLGTKTLAAASAKRWAGALEAVAAACSTSATIWAKAVPLPTRTARMRQTCWPTWRLQPMTMSPSFLGTGRLSPVSKDSSKAALRWMEVYI